MQRGRQPRRPVGVTGSRWRGQRVLPPLVLVVAPLVALAVIALGLPGIRGDTSPTAGALPSRSATAAPPASSGPSDPPDGPAAWTTVQWLEPVEAPFGPPDVLLRVDHVIATSHGYLAWGRTPMPGRNQFNDMGAVFVSTDGARWQAVPVDHGVNPLNASSIHAIAEGPGGYLAVGSVCCDPEQPAVWRSHDGLEWARIETVGPNAAEVIFSDVVGLDDGWAAMGSTFDHQLSVIWHSADGATWESGLEVPVGDDGTNLFDLAAAPEGAVAVGFVADEDGSWDGAVWSSADGRAWEQRAVGDPALVADEARLTTVIAHAGGFLATGTAGTAEQRRACEELGALRVASIEPLPQPRTTPDALSCVLGEERQWSSEDGDTWRIVEADDELRPIEFRLMAAVRPGIVLLGESTGPESPDTTLFVSEDGRSWMPFGPQVMLTEVALAFAVRGDEILAITEEWTGTGSILRVRRGIVR